MPGAGGARPVPTLAEPRTIRAETMTVAEAPPTKRRAGDIESALRGATTGAAETAAAERESNPNSAAQ